MIDQNLRNYLLKMIIKLFYYKYMDNKYLKEFINNNNYDYNYTLSSPMKKSYFLSSFSIEGRTIDETSFSSGNLSDSKVIQRFQSYR